MRKRRHPCQYKLFGQQLHVAAVVMSNRTNDNGGGGSEHETRRIDMSAGQLVISTDAEEQ